VPSPQLNKLDSRLQALVQARNVHRAAKRQAVIVGSDGRVLVDVYVRGRVPVAAKRLRALGMRVGATSARGDFRIVEGRLPVRAVRRAAALGRVRAVLTVPPPVLSVGAKTSQGDAAHRGPQARALGPTGVGVDVGIISDSINQVGGGVAASQASGDLPGSVTVLSDQTGATDEGRAMAEIAFDVAPGIARILFGSAFTGGPVQKAATIDSLVAAGADVIADDTAFLNEPFFQDGVVGKAVDRARAKGTVYFTAAGNQARQSWEGTFSSSGVAGPGGEGFFNDFDPGAGTDTIQSVVDVPKGGTLTVFLQWDEAFGQATTDMDIYLTNEGGTPIGSPGTSNNLVMARIPFDGATFKNTTAAAVPVAVRIVRAQGTRAPFMKYIATGDFPTFTVAEHATSSDAIVPDAATSSGSITVAAVRASEPGLNDPEVFSSRGPKTILFDSAGNRLATPEVRQKPELAAADGVSTTVAGFDPFFGTSAAAPHAAGVAALLRSRDPTLTPDAVESIMTSGQATTDCNPVGEPDLDCGFGFVFADGVLNLTPDPTPPVITPTLSPAAPEGSNGFYTRDVGLTWSVSDPGSIVTATSGCDPATVSADTPGTTLTCSATSGGGTASKAVTVKRDASPPTVPVLTGIAAQAYEQAFLPPASSIGCTADDPTSGIDPSGCIVSGYSPAIGRHTLVGTVRNNAGLTAVGSLEYDVIPTKPAISRLTAARTVALSRFLRRGLLARVGVARAGTRLTATLTGRGRVALTVRTAGAGRAALRLRPTRRGKALLRPRRRTLLKLVVTAMPRVGAPLTLRRTVVVRR
jgi:subtilisin family serine protease